MSLPPVECLSGQTDQAEQTELLQRYPEKLTPHLEHLIASGKLEIARQFLADVAELEHQPGLVGDPLAEQEHTPLPGLVRRHADRVLLLASDSCAATCRFCFRKGRSFQSYADLSPAAREDIFIYLADNQQVREVILTGGDPLMLDPGELDELLSRLHALPQLEMLRLHTRLPIAAPESITPRLLENLSGRLPLYVMLHVNNPVELTPEVEAACEMMSGQGLPLGSQTVLLKGVNDDATILEALWRKLLRMKVRPYYLHHPDVAAGTGHFRVSLERGCDLMEQLSARLSGLALPRYVVDLPGGKGKVPVARQTLMATGERAVVRTADGSEVVVPNREG